MKLLTGDENCALPLCAYVEGFCKSGHKCSFLPSLYGKSFDGKNTLVNWFKFTKVFCKYLDEIHDHVICVALMHV